MFLSLIDLVAQYVGLQYNLFNGHSFIIRIIYAVMSSSSGAFLFSIFPLICFHILSQE